MNFTLNIRRRRFLGQTLGAFILWVGSCKQSELPISESGATPSKPLTRITLSAAASMQNVLELLRTTYKAIDVTTEITYNFGSSGSLAQQIIQGAPVDVFLSAAPQWLDALALKGENLQGSRRDLVQNSMVLVVPKDHKTITDFQTLSRAKKIAMGKPESVPAGGYAKEVLTSMDLFDSLRPMLVFGKNVRHVLAYVETGNVDAGLVYATDALISEQVRIVATAPVQSHSAIVYSIAVVKDSNQPVAAQKFIDFLSSESAVAIFQTYGFTAIA